MGAVMKTNNSTISDYATKSMGVGNPTMIVNVCLIATMIILCGLTILVLIFTIRYAVRKFPLVKGKLMVLKYMLMYNSILRSFL